MKENKPVWLSILEIHSNFWWFLRERFEDPTANFLLSPNNNDSEKKAILCRVVNSSKLSGARINNKIMNYRIRFPGTLSQLSFSFFLPPISLKSFQT